jgi:hypothetical protein
MADIPGTNFSLTSYCAAESLGLRPHRRRLEMKRRTLRPLDGTQPAREILGSGSGPIKAATPDHDRRRTSSFDIDLHPPIKSSGVPAASTVASRSFASDPLASCRRNINREHVWSGSHISPRLASYWYHHS